MVYIVLQNKESKGVWFEEIVGVYSTPEEANKVANEKANRFFSGYHVHGGSPDADTKTCCICGKEFKGWGNNPYPVKMEGVCCDECNLKAVIPARLNV